MARNYGRKDRCVTDSKLLLDAIHTESRIDDTSIEQRRHATGACWMVEGSYALPDQLLKFFITFQVLWSKALFSYLWSRYDDNGSVRAVFEINLTPGRSFWASCKYLENSPIHKPSIDTRDILWIYDWAVPLKGRLT